MDANRSSPAWFGLFALLPILCLGACSFRDADSDDETVYEPNGFLSVSGRRVVEETSGRTVELRGINFLNDVDWLDYSNISGSFHHSREDFARVKNMGMNVIRFMLDYRFFESDDEPYEYRDEGWAWLDRNIAWANEYGLYLILDMQIAQGGGAAGTVWPLWTAGDPSRDRLKALWRAIADRYKEEPRVAAYDLLNEPFLLSDDGPWRAFAGELIAAIRETDRKRIVIVETAYGDENYELFTVNDGSVLYDAHFYAPHGYTHQFNRYQCRGDGGRYPFPVVVPNTLLWRDYVDSPRIDTGTTEWKRYESPLFPVPSDSTIICAAPVIASAANAGTVFFDDFFIEEFDAYGNPVRIIVEVDIEDEDPADFIGSGPKFPVKSYKRFWVPLSEPGDGTHVLASDPDPHSGSHSLSIVGPVSGSYSLNSPNLLFPVEKGRSYRIVGWMRGNIVSGGSGGIGLEFFSAPEGESVPSFDKSYLESLLRGYADFSERESVPVNIGEFGLMINCFEEDRGGLAWVEDSIDLFSILGFGYQYCFYHGSDFGLYAHPTDELPNPSFANGALIELLERKSR